MATSKKRSSETNKPPVARLRIGLIAASIWGRDTDNGSFYSVSFERRYKDAHDEWQSTHSYNADDLLILAKLADQAHSRILELQTEEAE